MTRRTDTTDRAAVTVSDSPRHDRGLRALRDLDAGQVATEAHAIVLDQPATDALAGHPLDRYLVTWDRDRAALPLGELSFVNHADDPNAEIVIDHDARTVRLVTLTSVLAGDELTVDYGPDHPV